MSGGHDDPRPARELDVLEESGREAQRRGALRRRDHGIGEALLAGAPGDHGHDAARGEPLRHGPERRRRPQLARPPAAGIEQREVAPSASVELLGRRGGSPRGPAGSGNSRWPSASMSSARSSARFLSMTCARLRRQGDAHAEQHLGQPLAPPGPGEADHAPRAGRPGPRRGLPQALQVERHVVADAVGDRARWTRRARARPAAPAAPGWPARRRGWPRRAAAPGARRPSPPRTRAAAAPPPPAGCAPRRRSRTAGRAAPSSPEPLEQLSRVVLLRRRRRSRPGRRTSAPPRARAPSPACSRCPCSGRRGEGRG